MQTFPQNNFRRHYCSDIFFIIIAMLGIFLNIFRRAYFILNLFHDGNITIKMACQFFITNRPKNSAVAIFSWWLFRIPSKVYSKKIFGTVKFRYLKNPANPASVSLGIIYKTTHGYIRELLFNNVRPFCRYLLTFSTYYVIQWNLIN